MLLILPSVNLVEFFIANENFVLQGVL